MTDKVVYLGRVYTLCKKGYYRRKKYSRGRYKEVCLHRQVWIDHYGLISPGHVILHIDGDPRNNTLENLASVPRITLLQKEAVHDES